MNTTLTEVKLFKPAVSHQDLKELLRVFPESHFARLREEGFRFNFTTFWYPLEKQPENIFESIVSSLKPLANPLSNVIGTEWWFSVMLTNLTPQWLLPYHFDRDDLEDKDYRKVKHPGLSSVLFLNTVPYGDLVVTDQVLTEKGARPRQPTDMRFIRPSKNQYVVFPGHLYHGVIGRMWRPVKATKLRITMAVNWWTEQPKATYLHDSREYEAAFRLKGSQKQ